MADQKKFLIAEFSDGLQVVPSCWMHKGNTGCWWPGHLIFKSKINRAIHTEAMPIEGEQWSTCKIKKIFGSSDDYVRALEKLSQTEDFSILDRTDFNSTREMVEKRKRVPVSTDEENDEDEGISSKRFSFQEKSSTAPTVSEPPYTSKLPTNRNIGLYHPQTTSTPLSSSTLFPSNKNELMAMGSMSWFYQN